MKVDLVNVVAGGDLGVTTDLHTLSGQLNQYSPNYEPEVSPGLYFELEKTGVTVMIFGSGKYHLTGGGSVSQIYEANTELVEIIETNLDVVLTEIEPEIRNLVYRGEFGMEFDLSELADDLPETVDYHPQNNPGLRYRTEDLPGLITVFRTGRFTVTGVKNEKESRELIQDFKSKIPTLMSDESC